MKQGHDGGSHTYCGTTVVVDMVHFLCQFVQQEGANPQDLDPEMVRVLIGRHVHLQMFIRLKAQVRTGNWTTQRVKNVTFNIAFKSPLYLTGIELHSEQPNMLVVKQLVLKVYGK